MAQLSREAQNVNWLVSSFVRRVPGIAHAIVVTSDGLLMAVSERLDRARADQLAAVASGLASLTQGASRVFGGGKVNQTAVEMEKGFLLVMSISDGSALAVLTAPSIDIGLVGYEMAMLVAQCGEVLTPALRAELQAALPR
ncbi:MAG TPA: roadblock/LC7 domain-containing protein [Actinomycetota bacterium]|jgi:predicted regulator of Ras-like GTPase activity (Roadblock/LC7/MglB family)|nr:roadblock/LC7 domain-containing protein [Actinomycetota bacterium]